VISQVSLSLILLIESGLFVRSLGNVNNINPGFPTDHLLEFTMQPSFSGYNQARTLALYGELQDRIAALPGVRAVSMGEVPVLSGDNSMSSIEVPGYQPKEGEMRSLAALARELGMATLVESHDAGEFALAEKIGAGLIGINNRDLHTFVTDIAVTERLLAGYKGDALIVTESGIDSPDDIRRLDAAGARAFLIGESLLRGGTPGAKLGELMTALVR